MHQTTVKELTSHNATPELCLAEYRRIFSLTPIPLYSYGVSLANGIRI